MTADHLEEIRRIKEQIHSKADIVDVVGKVVALTRKGHGWNGLCPFHADRRPSLTVSESHANYRCWSCGASGDVFTFVQKSEGLTFMEALEALAERYGVRYERRGITDEALSGRQRSLQILAKAEDYYMGKFVECPARAYIENRGVSVASILKWGIGYAPSTYHDCGRGITDACNGTRDELVAAGLFYRNSESGAYGSIFSDRIMFPIRDIHGTTIGFGGRAMGDAQPKYINSPQSAVFSKSAVLYGLDIARKNKPDSYLIVEGYLDVILNHQARGPHGNAIAPMGTALTDQHAKLLAPITKRVVLGYDADNAGRIATAKSYAVLKPYDIDVAVASLPDGEDPASMLAGDVSKISKFFACLGRAVPYIDFQIAQIKGRHPEQTQEGRAAALNKIIPVLAGIESSVELGSQVTQVATLHPLYHISQQAAVSGILRDIQACRWKTSQNIRPTGQPLLPVIGKPARVDDPKAVPVSRAVRLERALLSGMFDPVGRSIVVAVLNPQHMITPEGSLLYAAMLRFPSEENGAIDWIKFHDHIESRCINAPNVIHYLDMLFPVITQETLTGDILRQCAQYLEAIHTDMSDRLSATSLAAQCMEAGI